MYIFDQFAEFLSFQSSKYCIMTWDPSSNTLKQSQHSLFCQIFFDYYWQIRFCIDSSKKVCGSKQPSSITGTKCSSIRTK